MAALYAVNVRHLEDQINALYMVIVFTLPLIAGLMGALIALYYQVRGDVRASKANTATLTDVVTPKLDSLSQQVGGVHDAVKEIANGTNGGTNGGTGRH